MKQSREDKLIELRARKNAANCDLQRLAGAIMDCLSIDLLPAEEKALHKSLTNIYVKLKLLGAGEGVGYDIGQI